MPVTVYPTMKHARAIKTKNFAIDVQNLIERTEGSRRTPDYEFLQSSYGSNPFPSTIIPADNGLITTVVKAYSHHHHLKIRPEDIWFGILNQFRMYINRHAEQYRHLFVTHQGQKRLQITYDVRDRHDVDYSDFAKSMSELIDENIIDRELRDWIMPCFTTTTDNDMVVASILMMGTLQGYFGYDCCTACALPSVTLLGEKSDYEKLLRKLDYLDTKYGVEPARFARLLQPILSRFVGSFDDPVSPNITDFWQRIVHYEQRSGGDRLSGWIVAFSFWKENGTCLYPVDPDEKCLKLEGEHYYTVYVHDVPHGFTNVSVNIKERNSEQFNAEFTAGCVGIECSISNTVIEEDAIYEPEHVLDTMQPATAWWMVII